MYLQTCIEGCIEFPAVSCYISLEGMELIPHYMIDDEHYDDQVEVNIRRKYPQKYVLVDQIVK